MCSKCKRTSQHSEHVHAFTGIGTLTRFGDYARTYALAFLTTHARLLAHSLARRLNTAMSPREVEFLLYACSVVLAHMSIYVLLSTRRVGSSVAATPGHNYRLDGWSAILKQKLAEAYARHECLYECNAKANAYELMLKR